MTLTIKLDRNWSSFQLANSAPPLSVTGSAIAPSARMTFLTICKTWCFLNWPHPCESVQHISSEIGHVTSPCQGPTCLQLQLCYPMMGVLLIAVCHASATLEVLWASPACNLPCEKSGDKQVSSWRHISCHTDKNRYYT